ncbi:YkyB family protein [Pontibacillus yanchengensis]|uniref:YkyB family protein n=1 Tax=Pontibacillus yanchengensis TaxID=462910 RepID=UPI001F1FCB72|nr:YkyB family protein [Pontibacillus yanchengensis]
MRKSESHASIETIAQAIFVVNRHAKTAPEPRQLYTLKKKAIQQLLDQKLAKKVGLHFSDHPKYSHQHSTLLVQIADYYFHIPPKKEDFQTVKHLGNVDQSYRNPRPSLSLSKAKRILYTFLDWEEPARRDTVKTAKYGPKAYHQTSPFSPWGQFTSWNKSNSKSRRRNNT